MGKIYESISELTGHTPLLHLKNYEDAHNLKAHIYAKLEYYNPNQSIKDRIAAAMIDEAEESGKIKPGDTVVEMTSGNTGIGVAAFAAVKGYKSRIYIQNDVSEERFKSIKAFGGEAIKFEDEPHIKAALEESNDFFAAIEKFRFEVLDKEENVHYLRQSANSENPGIHERTTGPEIWDDTDGNVDVFVASVGTGGTVTGTGRFLKSKNSEIKVVAVEPAIESVKNEEHPDAVEITGVHRFVGICEKDKPDVLDEAIVDEVIDIQTDDSVKTVRELAKTEGILVGTSSGSAVYAASKLAQRPEFEGKNIVVILPDSGLRYLSRDLFDE